MAGSLLPLAKQLALTDAASPGVGYQFFTYEPGTLTEKATYSDSALTTANANPVIANARGEVVMYGTGLYRIILKDASDVTVWDRDNVGGIDTAVDVFAALLAASSGSSLVGHLGRTVAARFTDLLSVKDEAATGDGATDDTDEIDAAAADSDTLLFPDGTYLYTGDIDVLFSKSLTGAGKIRYDGFDYPVERREALNSLWPGEFRCWQMGHALNVETTQRRQIPAGVTHARIGLASGTSISHVEGTYAEDAIRIQRTASTSGTANHVMVINLTREETKTLAGRRCVLQFNGLKGADYSGSAISYRVQYSIEPEQPILNADGTYTSGNVNLLSGSLTLGTTARPESAPYFFAFDLPADATQVAVVVVVPFSGTAGADDFIEIESMSVHPGAAPANILREDFPALSVKGRTRHQSSYPYGAPRGTNTEQGAVSAVGINTAVNWALSIPVRFEPRMIVAPQFIFQSPTSGTESRLLNSTAGTNINGIAFSLSDSGAVITNNAAGVAGNRYLCHWTAQVIF